MKKIIITEEHKKNLFENTDLNKLTKMVLTNLDYYDTAFEIAKSLGILEELENNIELLLIPVFRDIASKAELNMLISKKDYKGIINIYIHNTRALIYNPNKGLPNYDPIIWGMLKNVKEVVLNEFSEGEIPQDLVLLPALERLSISDSNFNTIPHIDQLKNLYLANTSFSQLYKSIQQLPNLERLQIYKDESFTKFPSDFTHPNIKLLDLVMLSRMTDFDVKILRNFPKLEDIRIWGEIDRKRVFEIEKEINNSFPNIQYYI